MSKKPLFLVLVLFSFILLANREGRDQGNTNAPGESGVTCLNCHIRGPYTPILDVYITDILGNKVSFYLPDTKYNIEARIADVSAKAKTFGFQMVPLDGANNFSGTWGQLGSKVRKVNDLNRVYLTHTSPSSTGIFKADWTSPTTDVGNITFYLAGVTADGAGSSIGDNADTTHFVLPSLLNKSIDLPILEVNAFPTIVQNELNLSSEKELDVTIFDSSGNKMQNPFHTTLTQNTIDLSFLNNGAFFLVARHKDHIPFVFRFIKI